MGTNTVDGVDDLTQHERCADDFDPEAARLYFERARSFAHLADADRFDARERALWARRAERAREQFEGETGVEYRRVLSLR